MITSIAFPVPSPYLALKGEWSVGGSQQVPGRITDVSHVLGDFSHRPVASESPFLALILNRCGPSESLILGNSISLPDLVAKYSKTSIKPVPPAHLPMRHPSSAGGFSFAFG